MSDREYFVTAEMLELAREGDEGIWRALVDGLYPNVISIVRSHLPGGADEEDIAQDVFVKVFSKIDQYTGPQPFEHWVSRVALNTCYDRLRQKRSSRVVSFSDLGIDEASFLARTFADDPSESGETTREMTGELLAKLLAPLNANEQLVVRLIDLEEKSAREVADMTGWGGSKVRVTAMRARRKLARVLERMERDATKLTN